VKDVWYEGRDLLFTRACVVSILYLWGFPILNLPIPHVSYQKIPRRIISYLPRIPAPQFVNDLKKEHLPLIHNNHPSNNCP
jgi:hypothetical protein